MNIKKKLGLRIKELRKQKGYSQEKLAEVIEVSQNSLSKIELGENFLTSSTLEKLLLAFDISSSNLFNFEHLNAPDNLLKDIESYVESIKNDDEKVKTLFKIVKALAEK